MSETVIFEARGVKLVLRRQNARVCGEIVAMFLHTNRINFNEENHYCVDLSSV